LVKRKGLPEFGELVLCTTKKVTPFAGWCKLDEYPEAEGMIHISESAGKWVYDIRKFIKKGKQYVAKVVRINPEKNFVNLSLKRVSKREEREKINAWRKEQKFEKILSQAAKKLDKSLDQAYEEAGFLLQEKFGELSTAFEEASKSKDILLKNLPKEWADTLFDICQKTFKEKEIILKAEIELRSYARDGVNRIKEFLKNLEENGMIVKYISAPKYRAELKTTNPKQMEKKIREILEKSIEGFEGEAEYRFIK
jgi:translation initiation factor 2 subunit 1